MPVAFELAERVRFTDLLLELGPDAPTLCEGWRARDLAAHMVVIEHPEAWVGAGSRRIAVANRLYDRVMDRERSRPWAEQVARVRGGPIGGPFAWRVVRERMYIREYLIHHEDLRRANDLKPRAGIPELQAMGWKKATTVGKVGLRRAPLPADHGLTLVATGTDEVGGGPDADTRFVAVPGREMIEVHGEPVELLLFAFGRRSGVEVDLSGPSDAVDTLMAGAWKV
jgi:uncharacterized protein (TIGR03085 family)